MTPSQIAAQTGLSESGVYQAIRRYGLSKPRLSHKWAIPWKLDKQRGHNDCKTATYLAHLSSIAQGKEIPRDKAQTAFHWAERLVEAGLDIDYDRDVPPNDESIVGGFFTKEADPDNWHLKHVLERARLGAARQ